MEQLNTINEKNCHLLGGYVNRLFNTLRSQKDELSGLKKETTTHVWARKRDGKIELVPLDDDFDRIQSRIATLDSNIATNTALVDELNACFDKEPTEDLAMRVRAIQEEIENLERALRIKLYPSSRLQERCISTQKKPQK